MIIFGSIIIMYQIVVLNVLYSVPDLREKKTLIQIKHYHYRNICFFKYNSDRQ